MNKMIKLIFGLAFIFSTLSHAAAYADSMNCGDFHIQIANMTPQACALTSQKVIHGNVISAPPMTIMPMDSKAFNMGQTGYGPEILLSYQCGDENITFKSKQTVCLMGAGNIIGRILDPKPIDHTISYQITEGSWLWDRPGNINWTITARHTQ